MSEQQQSRKVSIEYMDGEERNLAGNLVKVYDHTATITTYEGGFVAAETVIPLNNVRVLVIEFTDNRRHAQA